MIPVAILGFVGDQIYLKGIKSKDLIQLYIASTIFPFEREILIGPAQLYYSSRIIDNNTLAILRNALIYDPYSIQFLGTVIQLEYLSGNKNEALILKQKLKKIAPNSNALKRINEIMKGFK